MSEPNISISANHLCKRFGSQLALTDLSFEVKKGEIVGFLGPNGAGKSTTLRILTGILPASSGTAYLCGLPVAHGSREIRRKIGYMPENNPLPEDMRVIEYLRFRARLKNIPWRQQKTAIGHAMEVCELHRKAQRKLIGTLSKGFRQRVGIADAILAKPEITILDEPTIGLDPHQVMAIRRLLNHLRGETTVIFSSHILSEVEISCDRVLILNQGRLVAAGTADELRREFLPGLRYRIELRGDRTVAEELFAATCPCWKVSTGEVLPDGFICWELSTGQNSADPDADAQLLRKLCQHPALRVRGFSPVQPTLEAIFLIATRRSWEQIDSAPGDEPLSPLEPVSR